MSAPDSQRLCPQCGLELPARGGCPHCLLRLALTAKEETDFIEREARETTPLPPGLRSRFFGDYEILEEIARGGMGVVYKARHLKLNRVVALKMIPSSHWVSPEARMRFETEVAAVAQLNHPNIVALYESGEFQGTHFFTMRLVEGGTLAERMKKEECRMQKRRDDAITADSFLHSPFCISARSPAPFTTRTNTASCTATSSRRTSSSMRKVSRRWRTSVWPRCWARTARPPSPIRSSARPTTFPGNKRPATIAN